MLYDFDYYTNYFDFSDRSQSKSIKNEVMRWIYLNILADYIKRKSYRANFVFSH